MRAIQPWMSSRLKTWSAMKSAATGAEVGRDAHRQRRQRVDRRAERDDAGEVLRAPVGRRLVGEHPALRIAGEVHVVAGGLLHGVDRLGQRDDVVGQVAAHAALDLVGFAEVDDPRVHSGRVQDPDRPVLPGDVPHVRRHHHRVHHQHRRPARFLPRPAVRREIAPQLVHRHALDDLGRRGQLPVSSPPSRSTSSPFCAVAIRRSTGLVTAESFRSTRCSPSNARLVSPRQPAHPGTRPRAGTRVVAHTRVAAWHICSGPRPCIWSTRRRWCSTRSSLGVNEGDRIGIVGRNGDGKSSLLRPAHRAVEPGFRPGDPPRRRARRRARPGRHPRRRPHRRHGHSSATRPTTNGPATRGCATSSAAWSPTSPGTHEIGTLSRRPATPGAAGGAADRRLGRASPSTSPPTTSTSRASPGWPAI